jgi:CHAT domain-containing protein/tetratricopeptide (TPR) repeat protein
VNFRFRLNFIKNIIALTAAIFTCVNDFSQCADSKTVCNKINNIDANKKLNAHQKISALHLIIQDAQKCKLTNDTSYVLALIKYAEYEFNTDENHLTAIDFTANALSINNSLHTKASKFLKIVCYNNLGSFYDRRLIYKQALYYYDSVLIFCNQYNSYDSFAINAFKRRADIFFRIGDYEKAVEESSIGMNVVLKKHDIHHYIYLLNRKAQSLFFEGNLPEALSDAYRSISIAENNSNELFELGTAYKILGLIYEKKKLFDSALFYYKLCVKTRTLTGNASQIASDYNDLANFYLNSREQYKTAAENYNKALLFAAKMNDSLARGLKQGMIYGNLAENSLEQNNLTEAENFFLQSFYHLNINLNNNILNSLTVAQLNTVMNKDLVIALMSDITDLLLEKFKQTNQKFFLGACINTSLLTDSIITKIRHELIGEKSKLYWRNKTRDFFSHAMEACYLAHNDSLAFYFMEKSRSVLLNDKLNELNASSRLPEIELLKQEELQTKILKFQQELLTLQSTSHTYQDILLQLLKSKKEYDQFIASLEKNYPLYYQYKYADESYSLKDLQQYLSKTNQCFVHYFIGDSDTYILAITTANTKFVKLSKKEFNKNDLESFLQLCSNKDSLNTRYERFSKFSNLICKNIFQQLQIPKGRVVICMDDIVIPFEALCTDMNGKNFLLQDYSFSYVYSAQFLMKQFDNPAAKGNFVGFAPVSFQQYLNVQDLKNSADALKASGSYYNNDKLFTYKNATRNNFFAYASSYSVVNIFSHASADTTDKEPVLFMQDSSIHLSELQSLDNPATKLVLLSACETNIGKSATGEGVYSLARGFAAAGIPSVAATLWNADEQAIYSISEKFNQYLSEGMNKDEALQKSKLYFIQHNSSEKMLPYYWANMIIIGNTDPIKLPAYSSNTTWHMIYFIISIVIAFTIIYTRKKILARKKLNNFF